MLALFLLFLNKGVPCIYYGTEIGLSGGEEPNCRESFPWSSNYNTDLRKYIKELVSFRKRYILLINNGIEWTAIGDDIIYGCLSNKDKRLDNHLKNIRIYVNRSRINNFLIQRKIFRVEFESTNICNDREVLPPQSFLCFTDE